MIVEPGFRDLGLEPLADDVELALEGVGVLRRAAAADEGVAHARLDGPGARAQRCVVGRERPPAQEDLPFLGDDPLEELHAEFLLGRVGRGEERADAVVLGLGQLDPQRPAARGQELVGNLDQDPGAVAGVVLAAAGAAVVQVDQRRAGRRGPAGAISAPSDRR